MEMQKTLLADLANFFIAPAHPKERLEVLRRDQLDANAEIRAVLDRLAGKHKVPASEVDDAMANIGLAIDDMTQEVENDHLQEVDIADPL